MQEISSKTKHVFSAYYIMKASLFGSYARNEQKNDSDIDILVELGSKMNLLDDIGLKQELEEALGKRVDLV